MDKLRLVRLKIHAHSWHMTCGHIWTPCLQYFKIFAVTIRSPSGCLDEMVIRIQMIKINIFLRLTHVFTGNSPCNNYLNRRRLLAWACLPEMCHQMIIYGYGIIISGSFHLWAEIIEPGLLGQALHVCKIPLERGGGHPGATPPPAPLWSTGPERYDKQAWRRWEKAGSVFSFPSTLKI